VTITHERRLSGAVVVLVGFLVATVPVFDIYDDVANQGDPLITALVENFPVLALTAGIVASGLWLAASDWSGRYARTVASATVASTLGVTLLITLIVFVQLHLQGGLKPLIIAADAVIIGAIGGVIVGIRTAQQQRAVDDARRQRNRARALFENHRDAVAIVRQEGDDPVVADVNGEFEATFGSDAARLDGLDALKAAAESDADRDGVDPASGDAVRREVTCDTVGGEREFLRQTVPIHSTASVAEAYVVYTDITAQKEREYQLEFLNSLLRHHIQNGMTVIRSRAAHLRDTLDGREAAFAATIEDRSDDLAGLTDRFRVMLDALIGDVDEELGAVPLAAVVDEQAAALATAHPGAEVTTDVPDLSVRADALLENVVWNLLSNAIKHNDAETPAVTVTAEDRGDTVRLAIADNGPGVPDELKDSIFRRQASGVQNDVGSGFGLFFVDSMVTRYGGDVWVEDNTPEGAVFVVSLPKPA